MKNLWERLPFNSPGPHLEHFGAANMPGWQEKMHANIKRPRIISPSVSWLHCFTDCSLGLEIMLHLGAHCVPGAHSMALIAQQFRNGISLMTSWHCSHRIEPTRFFLAALEDICWKRSFRKSCTSRINVTLAVEFIHTLQVRSPKKKGINWMFTLVQQSALISDSTSSLLPFRGSRK